MATANHFQGGAGGSVVAGNPKAHRENDLIPFPNSNITDNLLSSLYKFFRINGFSSEDIHAHVYKEHFDAGREIGTCYGITLRLPNDGLQSLLNIRPTDGKPTDARIQNPGVHEKNVGLTRVLGTLDIFTIAAGGGLTWNSEKYKTMNSIYSAIRNKLANRPGSAKILELFRELPVTPKSPPTKAILTNSDQPLVIQALIISFYMVNIKQALDAAYQAELNAPTAKVFCEKNMKKTGGTKKRRRINKRKNKTRRKTNSKRKTKKTKNYRRRKTKRRRH